jgi:hypothetical protein
MTKLAIFGFASLAFLFISAAQHPVAAADTSQLASPPRHVHSRCAKQWYCGPGGCGWRRHCPIGCPDAYSCYPLYGAYGPYGGVRYWAAFTRSGWGR